MNVRLMVLGLLRERPQHGYELHKWLEVSRTELWAGVLPGSIYHALRQMEKEQLVEVQNTERTGNRTRAIYAITEQGQAEFERLLNEGWKTTSRSFPTTLYTLLTFSDTIPQAQIHAAIQHQISLLQQELTFWNEGETIKLQEGAFPHWLAALFENGRLHLEADLQLLNTLLEEFS